MCTLVYWLNNFPAEEGISDNLSPRIIITGTSVDFSKHCKIAFGTYVYTHEAQLNSMNSRTVGALAIKPTGNVQGGYCFYNLKINHLTDLRMQSEVINKVEKFAQSGGLTIVDPDGGLYEVSGVNRKLQRSQ